MTVPSSFGIAWVRLGVCAAKCGGQDAVRGPEEGEPAGSRCPPLRHYRQKYDCPHFSPVGQMGFLTAARPVLVSLC